MRAHGDDGENGAQNDDGNKIDARQSRADEKRHAHRADQTDRRTHTHAQQHLVGILQVGHICGQTGDKTCGAEFVNVGKRKESILQQAMRLQRDQYRRIAKAEPTVDLGKDETL